MFRARLPSIFITSHKMPRLPQNLHLVATWRSPDNAIRKNTQHDTSEALRLPCKMAMDTSKALRLPRKLQLILRKRRTSVAPATHNDFLHVTKHVWMSRSATPATRNAATRRWKHPKVTPFAELTIGTATRPSRKRLRTVANGCGRLRTVRQRRANTPSTPRPPEWNGNPCYAFGKNEGRRQAMDLCTGDFWSERASIKSVWSGVGVSNCPCWNALARLHPGKR